MIKMPKSKGVRLYDLNSPIDGVCMDSWAFWTDRPAFGPFYKKMSSAFPKFTNCTKA